MGISVALLAVQFPQPITRDARICRKPKVPGADTLTAQGGAF